MSFANSDNFTSFPIWISYISFYSLIAMARTSKTMLNITVVKVYILVMFLILEEKLCFSPLRMMLAWFCHMWLLPCWGNEVDSLYAHFLESFFFFLNQKWVLNFAKSFFCIYWGDHMVFIFQFVDMVYHIDWFADIKEFLHPWINPTWSWCMILLKCSWIKFANILLRIFASMFISDIGLQFPFFLVVSFSGFNIRVMVAS